MGLGDPRKTFGGKWCDETGLKWVYPSTVGQEALRQARAGQHFWGVVRATPTKGNTLQSGFVSSLLHTVSRSDWVGSSFSSMVWPLWESPWRLTLHSLPPDHWFLKCQRHSLILSIFFLYPDYVDNYTLLYAFISQRCTLCNVIHKSTS